MLLLDFYFEYCVVANLPLLLSLDTRKMTSFCWLHPEEDRPWMGGMHPERLMLCSVEHTLIFELEEDTKYFDRRKSPRRSFSLISIWGRREREGRS